MALPGEASATTMPYTTLPELVEMSDVIVRGTVDNKRSFVDPETERITTRTTVEVETTYLGSPGKSRLPVEQWGGEVGDRGLRIPGNAHYQKGEEVLLFLEYNENEGKFPLYLAAMAQAKFRIEDRDGDEVIYRTVDGVNHVDPENSHGRLEEPTPFAEFEARLEALIYANKRAGTPSEK